MVRLVVETFWIGDSLVGYFYFAVDCRDQADSFVCGLFDFEPDKVKHYSFDFLGVDFLVPNLDVDHQTISKTFKFVKN